MTKTTIDEELTYDDYVRILRAKNGEYERKGKDQMAQLIPYFEKDYINTDRSGAIWLTRKGVDVLLAVGCDPLRPQEFLENYPHMLDTMRNG
tara:strand:+ start:683 stop:958 length:276 start_codon:yes stop_codon:yes gene_type:complete